MSNDWADHDLRPALKTAGIYDPDAITLQEAIVPPPAGRSAGARRSTRSRKLTGDAARGKDDGRRAA